MTQTTTNLLTEWASQIAVFATLATLFLGCSIYHNRSINKIKRDLMQEMADRSAERRRIEEEERAAERLRDYQFFNDLLSGKISSEEWLKTSGINMPPNPFADIESEVKRASKLEQENFSLKNKVDLLEIFAKKATERHPDLIPLFSDYQRFVRIFEERSSEKKTEQQQDEKKEDPCRVS